jgi:3-hydroxyisobutyrate dehydrogenase-like beta-hydroxyacid dehydrogenase
MGSQMVNRLLSKGHSVTGYNRTRAKAQWLVEKGMHWADSPRAVASASDYTFAMVTNAAALASITEGPDGMLAGLGVGKTFIDMSTVSPTVSRALAASVRALGADMVDSPVSGSVITLEEGKLSVMVGGRKETFDKIKPLLLDIGPKVSYVGDNGLALSMKIAINLSLAVQMLAFSEGVLLAEKSGIAREVAVDVRLPDDQVPRTVRPAPAGTSLVRCKHDAERYGAGDGPGPATRRAAAHHSREQRISDGGSWPGLGEV